MDYKIKYEQAIKRAKAMIQVAANQEEVYNGVITIFPELAESEDERVRKELIDQVVYIAPNNDEVDSEGNVLPAYQKRIDKYIAWLEKQGGQKPCMIQWKGDNLKEVIDFTGKDKNFDKWFKSFEEYEKFVREHEGILKLFNEDGSHYEVPVGAWIVKTPDGRNVASKAVFKQKPADKIEPKFHEGDIVKRKDNPHLTYILKRLTDDGDYEFHAIGKDGNEGCTCFAGVKYQDDWELVEQKPAWSEEDDRMMNDTLAVVDWYAGKHRNISVKVSNWLKLLKNRVLSSSLRGFDKEEGNVIDHLIAICDDAMCYDTFAGCSKKDIEKYKTFLTNLKFGINPQPQNTWKPSEEQMKTLGKWLDDTRYKGDCRYVWPIFDLLYEQLKKLREE